MCFYFLEYASRSAPAVMIPELTRAFGMTAVGVSAILGTYYYTYSMTSLIAGAALDRRRREESCAGWHFHFGDWLSPVQHRE